MRVSIITIEKIEMELDNYWSKIPGAAEKNRRLVSYLSEGSFWELSDPYFWGFFWARFHQ